MYGCPGVQPGRDGDGERGDRREDGDGGEGAVEDRHRGRRPQHCLHQVRPPNKIPID